MKNVLFLTTYASPYRVRFFDELAKSCCVTVLFSDKAEEQAHRDAAWFVQGEGRARLVQLSGRNAAGGRLCPDVLKWLRKDFDVIVVCGYSSPTAMLAIAYLRARKRSFYMEVDGGMVQQDSQAKLWLKRRLVRAASEWISSGEATSRYLIYYGARPEKIHTYPFTSLYAADLLPEAPSPAEKAALRQKLGMTEGKIVLAVGQMIPRKGLDVLLDAAALLPPDTGVYLVGGVPDEILRRKAAGYANVHFGGFQRTEALCEFYCAADVLAMPTRWDVWGLVVNEAMACGLPVVTTDRCVAGLELVENGVNGYIVPTEDPAALAEKLGQVLAGDAAQMGRAALEKIRPYTLENMAKAHVEIFEGRR